MFRETNKLKQKQTLVQFKLCCSLRLQRGAVIIICIFCVLLCPSVLCVPAYLVGARQEWHETKPEKRSGWCRLAVFFGSQMAWGAERSARLRLGGHVEEGGQGVCVSETW